MKTINVKLSPQGVMDAINEIKQYQKDVENKVRLLLQRLTDFGAEVARIKIVSMGAYYSGELLSGVDASHVAFTRSG